MVAGGGNSMATGKVIRSEVTMEIIAPHFLGNGGQHSPAARRKRRPAGP
jgi:hypothetical protein